MKKNSFLCNCKGGRMLLVIVCLAATFASPQRVWADDIVSVTIDGNTTYYGIVDEAMQAANAATSDVTVTLLANVELMMNPANPVYYNISFTNTNTVTEGSETRPVMTTLDLNGHTLSSKYYYVIGVDNGTSVTITGGTVENTADFAIQNEGVLYTNNIVINASKGIYNYNAEAYIRGGNITANSYCIDNRGTIEVSGTMLTASSWGIDNYDGVATIGEGVSFKNCGQNGIYNENSGTLKITALPTFTNSVEADIRLAQGTVIDFSGAEAPLATAELTQKIKVDVGGSLPVAFTKGYKAAFTNSTTGTTVDPAEVFTVSGANFVLAGGEAIAYDPAKPLVAMNTASDGSIEFYTENSTTDAIAALRAAVTAANAAESDVTVTLLANVDILGETVVTFNNTNTVGSGDDKRTVKMTLDLNGKTITGSGNKTKTIEIAAGTKLTICDSGTDGNIKNTNNGESYYAVYNSGTLEIAGGTFETGGASDDSQAPVIYNATDATLTVSGGTIGVANDHYAIHDEGGTINISGGTIIFSISGIESGLECQGTLNVSGGTFVGNGTTSTGIGFYGSSFNMTALPTFQGEMSLNIATTTANIPIDFTDAPIYTAAPDNAKRLKIGCPDPTNGAYALTKGYSTHFVGDDGVIAPDEVFALSEYVKGVLYLYKGEVYVATATVTIGESTTPCGTLAKAATAANAAEGAATIKMLADVNVSGFTQLGSAAGVTLDLNGHTISGSLNGPPIVYVTGKATITDLSESHQGKIKNTQMSSVCVVVSAEGNLTVNNVTIIGGNIAINNGGALTVGNATITANNVYEGGSKIGIQNSGTLTLTALPDFSGNDCDIYIINGSKIGIGGDITALPGNFSRITLRVQEPTIGDNYQDVKLPFAFTNGYGGHCTTIDPANLFEYRNKNGECTIQLVAGEAVAVASETEFVAATKDADGNITGLYAKGGTYDTDAAALAAAVEALADGATLTLCKNVEGVSNNLIVSTGTDAAPVTIDLDGHTVTGNTSADIFYVHNAITGDAHAVIKNGTVVNSNSHGGYAILNYDNLVLSNVSASGYSGIHNNGALTVTGGTVEGTGSRAIYNNQDATLCSIGDVTIKSDGFYGIQAYKDVTLTAWPTFSGNLCDIVLGEGVNIVIGSDFLVPDTDYSPIKVDGDIGSAFTTGFSADAVGADVWQVFAGRKATYVVDADSNGQGVIYNCGNLLSFPSGLSTYYSAESLMPAETDDDYSAFVVTGVTDGAVVVKQLPSGIIPANTPVIVRNTSKNSHGLDFVTDQVAWKKTEFAATIATDLGGATPAEEFVGTATDITAYVPANGATLYGLNGEAFVRLDEKPDIAANRCWLEIPGTASARTRTLTIVFDDGDTTGIQTPPLTPPLEGAGSEARYNLQGQRVADNYRGIVIMNGKKMIIK